MKKNLRILSPDLWLLAEIDDYEYLSLRRSYHIFGKFELRINSNKKHVDKLQKNNLIMLDNDPHRVAIIQHREIGLDEDGKKSEQWIITGSTLETVTKQRVVIPVAPNTHDSIEGNGETAMKHYINNHLVNPVDPKRKMPNLVIAPDLQRGKPMKYASRYGNLSEDLESLSKISGMGWEIHLDLTNRQWVFDCYEGVDRTTNQSIVPPIIFSTDFGTLKGASFAESILDYKNIVYVAGAGEGATREVAEVGTGEGLTRYEKFTDASNTEDLTLQQQGENELKELKETMTFDASIETRHSPFEYEKDWFIGDIVTVVHKEWGVVMHARVTSVLETYDSSGANIEVEFGKGKTTIISKIKAEIKQYNNGIRK